MSPKVRTFWPLLFILVAADCSTKQIAVDRIEVHQTVQPFASSFVRFTLAYNPGMAYGFDLPRYLGDWARPVLIVMFLVVLAVLLRMYRHAAPRARLMAAGLALTCGGAIGNLIDRVRSPLGVVDFIDVGIGHNRFWIFNVADAGLFIGAFLLGLALVREDRVTKETAS